MSADWPCDHCGKTRGGEPHTCDPVDLAEEVEARSNERIDELEERVDELEQKVATLTARLDGWTPTLTTTPAKET